MIIKKNQGSDNLTDSIDPLTKFYIPITIFVIKYN